MTQAEALHILKMGYSVFLTGAAGTGKTFVLNEYINYLKLHNIDIAITASTGIAATHINGQTIHSWSGIGILNNLDEYTLDKLLQNEKLYKKYKQVKVLIIDEISMLQASKLDMLNLLFKKFYQSEQAFGGVQIVFCGDFFQLPPVVKSYTENSLLENNQVKDLAYTSRAWSELNPIICYLEKNFRQEDNELNDILNQIRYKKEIPNIFKTLIKQTQKQIKSKPKEIIKLFTHNVDVDSINLRKYQALNPKHKEYTYNMTETGKKVLIENLKKNCLASENLYLKKGTKVIFIKNDKNKIYQNGTLGEVVGFSKDNLPVIETYTGKIITPSSETWQYVDDNGKVLAEICQLPIRYAWAITVHKSQGMTLDAAEIDLSKAFGSGMGYVALSRVKKLENLYLLGISLEALKIDNEILEQDAIFKQRSILAVEALDKYLDKEHRATQALIRKQKDFILKSNGSEEEVKVEEELENKKTTYSFTLEFLKNQISLTEISKTRNLTLSTIISHIEKLLGNKELYLKDIKYILEVYEKPYTREELLIIKKILEQDLKLKDKFKKLNHDLKIKIDYDTIKILSLTVV